MSKDFHHWLLLPSLLWLSAADCSSVWVAGPIAKSEPAAPALSALAAVVVGASLRSLWLLAAVHNLAWRSRLATSLANLAFWSLAVVVVAASRSSRVAASLPKPEPAPWSPAVVVAAGLSTTSVDDGIVSSAGGSSAMGVRLPLMQTRHAPKASPLNARQHGQFIPHWPWCVEGDHSAGLTSSGWGGAFSGLGLRLRLRRRRRSFLSLK